MKHFLFIAALVVGMAILVEPLAVGQRGGGRGAGVAGAGEGRGRRRRTSVGLHRHRVRARPRIDRREAEASVPEAAARVRTCPPRGRVPAAAPGVPTCQTSRTSIVRARCLLDRRRLEAGFRGRETERAVDSGRDRGTAGPESPRVLAGASVIGRACPAASAIGHHNCPLAPIIRAASATGRTTPTGLASWIGPASRTGPEPGIDPEPTARRSTSAIARLRAMSTTSM